MSEAVSSRAAAQASTIADDTAEQTRSTTLMSGAHLAARALRNEGVDTIFTCGGGHIAGFYDRCADEGIRIVDVRHEQVAAHAADGYARQTGRLGCVVTPAGPGCTNAVTGVATAYRSESPLIHIGGEGTLAQHGTSSLRDLPHVDMMAPITKFAATIPSTERVADMISIAAREAFNGAPGPAYLEIARDVLDREIDAAQAVTTQPGRHHTPADPAGDPHDIEALADLLANAERPAILYGQQVWTARGHEAAIALLRGLDLPGYFDGASRGLLPPGDPHHFDRTRARAFANADLIVIVGAPFDFRTTRARRSRRELKLAQIDMDYRAIARNRDIDLGLVGDPGAILGAVLQAASGRIKGEFTHPRQARQAWMRELAAAEDAATAGLMPLFRSDSSPIHPYRLAHEINEFLSDDTIYIGDGGDVVAMAAQAVRPRRPGQWMSPGALGALGVGTGFAIAAGLANPGKEVLCYYCDAAFSMTSFDMETANRFGVPYIAVVASHTAAGRPRYGQSAPGAASRDVPYGKFAEMLGGYGEEVCDPAKIAGALRRARESVRTTLRSAVVNIKVDPAAHAPHASAQTMHE